MLPRSDIPAPRTVRWLFFSVILLFPVMDLLVAFLYHTWGDGRVIYLRYYRDLVCLLLAMCAVGALPYQLRLSALLYGVWLVFYALVSLAFSVVPPAVMVASLGTLMLPFSLTFAAFYAVRTVDDMRWLIRILILYAVASALFGVWEIDHTEFWTDRIDLGSYIWNVKGVTTGFQPTIFLPWNFNGLGDVRRAAGLLAAPLAQGFFLAVIGIIAFAYVRGRSLLLAAAIMALCFYGAAMSGTRGALLMMVLATLFYFLSPAPDSKTRNTNLALVTLFAMVSFQLLAHYVLYTVRLEDNSTLGHVNAIEKNLREIGPVLVVGSGIGAAGGQASSVGLAIEGGGEGAFFSIAYQLGLPGALLFLWFMWRLFVHVMASRSQPGTVGEVARALGFLFIGVTLSMFTSEHVLTFSGMGAFWFLTGGYLGYRCRVPSDG